jgi:hypothetical protein
VEEGKVDEIGEIVEGFRRAGLMAGIGGHKLETTRATVQAGIRPDFYMCTVNRVGYHSSNPERVQAYMRTLEQPWIGFKVLGAGRDKPEEGFRHAFQRGVDFLTVGMFDWQIREDAALVKKLLTS